MKTAFGKGLEIVDICNKIEAMKTNFFNIIPGADGVATLMLYGDVGDGEKVDSAHVVSELLALQQTYSKIDIRINSIGGDVYSGIAIYHALKTSKADITIYVDGVAASIAAVIALCGKPLYMSPHAQLMIHSVSAGSYGNADELRRTAEQIDQLETELAKMISGRCHLSPEEVQAKYFDRQDHWISAQEALELQLIDGIFDLPDAAPESLAPTEVYNYFNNRLETQMKAQSQQEKEMALIDEIKQIPTFQNMGDEKAIVAHITTLANKATKVEALEQANQQQQERIAQLEAKEITTVLDKAVAEGRISKEQVPAFTNMMKSDRANTEALLATFKPHNRGRLVEDFIKPEGQKDQTSFSNLSWDELDKADKLAELKEKDYELFCNKFKEKYGTDYRA